MPHDVQQAAPGERRALQVAAKPDVGVIAAAHRKEEGAFASLLQSVYALPPDQGAKVIQFVGPSGREGTSTIARRFALFSASKMPRPVCLVDVAPQASKADNLETEESTSWPVVAGSERPIEECLSRVVGSDLYVANGARAAAVGVLAQQLDAFFQKVRSEFTLIVLDSMAIDGSTDALMMSRKVDGVVLVIEAERTSQSAAETACHRIVRAGGRIIGLVLNKRKHHLPGFLRELLGFEERTSSGRKGPTWRGGRALGYVLTVLAGMAFSYELVLAAKAGAYRTITLGELWSELAPSSLIRMQSMFQHDVQPDVSITILQSVLACPAWALAASLGVALIVVAWQRKRGDVG
jgi:Mrp family chromosome partitioning ATPase